MDGFNLGQWYAETVISHQPEQIVSQMNQSSSPCIGMPTVEVESITEGYIRTQ